MSSLSVDLFAGCGDVSEGGSWGMLGGLGGSEGVVVKKYEFSTLGVLLIRYVVDIVRN